MKKLIIVLVVLAVGAGGYFVWKKYFSSDDLVKSIPQDAIFVGAFDFKSIVEKAGGKQLNDMNMMKRLREEIAKEQGTASQVALELMDDPLKSGINFLKRVYFFVDGKDKDAVVGMTCGLLNSEDFENMMKKFPMKYSIKQDGDFKSLRIEEVLFTWNKKQLIIVGADKKTGLDDYVKSLFDHTRPSITAATGFSDFNGNKFDMGMFMNYGSLFDFTKLMHWPAMTTMPEELYKGAYVGYVAQFNDNSIEAKMKYYNSDSKMSEYLMIMNEKGISRDQAKMVTTKNVFALLTFSINPEKTLGLFEKQEQFSGIFKEIEQQIGLKKDDLKNLTNGEITLAMVDVKNEVVMRKKYMYNETTHEMDYRDVQDTTLMPVFTASMGIKDRQVFDKLMQRTGLQKQGAYYVINIPDLQIYMVDNKTGITLTNDQALADELAQKKELAEMPEPAKTLATKSACAFYLDLNLQHYPQQVTDMMQGMMRDGYPAFQKTMAMFEDMEATTTDRTSGMFELKLVQGTDNSLHRILDTIDKNVYAYVADQEAKQKKMMEEFQAQMQQRMDSVSKTGAYTNYK